MELAEVKIMLLTVRGTFVTVPVPQAATVPSLRTPRPKLFPAAMATMLVKLGGTFVAGVEPQATTVPSVFKASANELLAAMATTLLSPGGGNNIELSDGMANTQVTSGQSTLVHIGNYGGFIPNSGTASFIGLDVQPTISTTGSYSGNVTALDIRLDSADERGFRVWRTNVPIRFEAQGATDHFKSNNPADSAFSNRRRQLSFDKIAQADYAQRTAENMGTRFLRAELFPEAKGPLDQVPKVGSRVVITGELAWDGDGHLEIHPRRPSDVKLINGEFLDSDDDIIIE